MCGLFGSTLSLSSSVIDSCFALLSRRGPDDSGFINHSDIFLGHVRLSISDLSDAGHQPFSLSDNYTLVYNGEIYNTAKLRDFLASKSIEVSTNCDTELLYLLLVNFGIEYTLDLVEGMFGFAFFDKLNSQVFLCRDHVGIKPLYYSLLNGLSFSSAPEVVDCILNDSTTSPCISSSAIYHYLLYGYNSDTSQFNAAIKSLPPGHYMCFDINSMTSYLKAWYSFPSPSFSNSSSVPKLSSQLESILSSVVLEQSTSDASACIFLSGGIDSTLLACLLKPSNIRSAFTLQYEGFSDESSTAELIADKLGLDLNISKFDFYSYDLIQSLKKQLEIYPFPFANSTTLSLDALSSQASSLGYKVGLVGDGADELFNGYPRYKATSLNYRIFSSLSLVFFRSKTHN